MLWSAVTARLRLLMMGRVWPLPDTCALTGKSANTDRRVKHPGPLLPLFVGCYRCLGGPAAPVSRPPARGREGLGLAAPPGGDRGGRSARGAACDPPDCRGEGVTEGGEGGGGDDGEALLRPPGEVRFARWSRAAPGEALPSSALESARWSKSDEKEARKSAGRLEGSPPGPSPLGAPPGPPQQPLSPLLQPSPCAEASPNGLAGKLSTTTAPVLGSRCHSKPSLTSGASSPSSCAKV